MLAKERRLRAEALKGAKEDGGEGREEGEEDDDGIERIDGTIPLKAFFTRSNFKKMLLTSPAEAKRKLETLRAKKRKFDIRVRTLLG